ncbi:hypothetical protein [Micromonospora sp. NBC_01796]|uniref:hypothetical protein n=1 Tax=Micromonospora sp. NBC_01796 TaxID=2975987 RepID=UPI002DD8671B|nr:hypothetical protein [Micromonospora sp. NBC_01796]WSA88307.1 hypothetical protein OIE47_12215 [Micromonospora sp. NBC_01796]
MNGEKVQLKLSGRLSYDDEITIAQAARIVALLNGPADPEVTAGMPSVSAIATDAVHRVTPPVEVPEQVRSNFQRNNIADLREALEASEAKTNAEKIVALAAYLLQADQVETFTLDAIKPLFRRAREAVPGNLARDLVSAIRSGWIGEAEAKGELFLTARAEKVLETGFGAIRPKRGAGTKPRGGVKKTRSATTPDTFAEIDDIPNSIEGVPNYHEVKLKRDKLLWALKLAKDLGVKSLSNREIVWLTDHVGDGIESGDINGHFRGLRKNGYANRSTTDRSIRITPPGEAYLSSLS